MVRHGSFLLKPCIWSRTLVRWTCQIPRKNGFLHTHLAAPICHTLGSSECAGYILMTNGPHSMAPLCICWNLFREKSIAMVVSVIGSMWGQTHVLEASPWQFLKPLRCMWMEAWRYSTVPRLPLRLTKLIVSPASCFTSLMYRYRFMLQTKV